MRPTTAHTFPCVCTRCPRRDAAASRLTAKSAKLSQPKQRVELFLHGSPRSLAREEARMHVVPADQSQMLSSDTDALDGSTGIATAQPLEDSTLRCAHTQQTRMNCTHSWVHVHLCGSALGLLLSRGSSSVHSPLRSGKRLVLIGCSFSYVLFFERYMSFFFIR